MAIARGQTDRFGNPIPPNQSVKVFINADGTVPQQRETVKLDANIVASDDPATQATVLTLGTTPSNAISSLTTDVVATGPGAAVATIQAGVVTNAKLATAAANTVKGNTTGSTAAVTDIPTTGSTSGRLALPVLIGDVQGISASASATVSFVAGVYREIRIISRTQNGLIIGNACKINFNSDVGNNYDSASTYAQGASTVAANAQTAAAFGQLALTASATSQSTFLDITVEPLLITSVPRPFKCTFIARGSTDATFITGTSNGFWKDTTTAMTSIVITYGNAATGTVEAWGILA